MTTAATDTTSLHDAQRRAISDSGWGASFRFVQPRNFSFWVMLFLLVAGAFATWGQYSFAFSIFPESFAQGVMIFAAYTLVFVFVIVRLDRYSSIPGRAALLVFLFGGLTSTFAMSAPLNDAARSLMAKTIGTDFMLDWGAGLIAPISEETTKILPLVLMIAIAPQLVRSAFDGFIIGAWSGLGFMILEDVSYVFGATGANFGQAEFGIQTAFVRMATGFFGHPVWSAIVGAGVVYLLGRPNEPAQRGRGVVLIITPMVLHGVWDAPTAIAGGSALSAVIQFAVAVVTIILARRVYRMTVAREREWARAILAPEVVAGVISDDELDAGIGPRKQRKHFVKSKQGRRERKAAEAILEGVRDLADELAASNGSDSPGVAEVRLEIAALR